MSFRFNNTWNPPLNKVIEKHVKDVLEQKTGIPHLFEPGAIYVHEESKFIAGALFEIQGKSLWIDTLWVDSPFQKQGVGSLLIDRLVEVGKRQECETLQLNTYFAKSFFEKTGFNAIAMIPQ